MLILPLQKGIRSPRECPEAERDNGMLQPIHQAHQVCSKCMSAGGWEHELKGTSGPYDELVSYDRRLGGVCHPFCHARIPELQNGSHRHRIC